MFKDVINLISTTYTENDLGDMVETPIKRQVFANKKSIRQSEFYQAAVTGLKPELMFVMRTCDYQQEEQLEYSHSGLQEDFKTYSIIRTYDKDGGFTELICQGVVNGVV